MLKPYRRAEIEFHEIFELTEQGKNSRVYVVNDSQLDARLVIKEFQRASITNPTEYFQEAKILYKSRHPNVVQVHYACMDNDNIYIAMPYYEKGSINRLMGARCLTVREVVRYACQFLTGLHNIHAKGLIHFDIKPDNILICDNSEAALSDFGLARETNLQGVAETDRWYQRMLPPEAIGANIFTIAFDIYQAGLTLYRMTNGNNAYRTQLDQLADENGNISRRDLYHAVRNGQFPDRDASAYGEHVPPRLINAIRKCLEVDPDDRFESVLKLTNELSKITGSIDWQYDELENGDRIWRKNEEDGRIRVLEIDANGNSTAYTENNGRRRRVNAYCINGINRNETKRFLSEN